ncbi:MAG: hypothetical protein OJF59_001808 [Cytophagales bacterium]|nr:MAG: hypothetical protein OJF59_001808 [Cytophagales bacterium]
MKVNVRTYVEAGVEKCECNYNVLLHIELNPNFSFDSRNSDLARSPNMTLI